MLAQSEELALTLEAKEAEILEAAAKQIEKGATRTQASVITEAMTEMTEAVGKSVGKAMGKAEVGGKAIEEVRWSHWTDLPKKVLQDREYAKINGRLYTRHAVDRMTPKNFGRAAGGSKGRGIPTLIVEDVIENGVITKTEIAKNGAKRITKSLNDVHVVLEGNIVITTIDTGSKGL